jgi:hypothetical protein
MFFGVIRYIYLKFTPNAQLSNPHQFYTAPSPNENSYSAGPVAPASRDTV